MGMLLRFRDQLCGSSKVTTYQNPPLKKELSWPAPAKSRSVLVALAIALGVLSYFAVAQWTQRATNLTKASVAISPPPAAINAADTDATESAIRFYFERVRRDPEDARSQTALAEYYLQSVRESGNEDYLPMAIQAARASLAAVDAARNIEGLPLARAEFANQRFRGGARAYIEAGGTAARERRGLCHHSRCLPGAWRI